MALTVRILLILALAALSLGYEQATWRYEDAEGDVLRNADFSLGAQFWYRPRGAAIAIDAVQHGAVLSRERADAVAPYILQSIGNFAAYKFLRIGAEVRLEELRPGPSPWQRAVVTLESFSAPQKQLRYWPHDIATLSGGAGWQAVSRIVPVPPADLAQSMRLLIYMGADQGRMAIRGITAQALTETDLSRVLGRSLMLGWILAGLFCLWPLLRGGMVTPVRGIVLAMAVTIIAGALTPHPYLGQAVGQARILATGTMTAITSITQQMVPDETAEPAQPQTTSEQPAASQPAQTAKTGKAKTRAAKAPVPAAPAFNQVPAAEHMGHLAAYLIFSVAAFAAYGRRYPIKVAASLCVFAAASETLQSFIITRDAEWLDLAYNGMGIAGGIVLAAGAYFIFAMQRSRSYGTRRP